MTSKQEKTLFTEMPVPPRLARVHIPLEERQPIIDYFTALATTYRRYSDEGSQINMVIDILKRVDDVIKELEWGLAHYQDEQCKIALEMLYAVRHRLEEEVQ